jgi:alcohol dehydrogenase class IV
MTQNVLFGFGAVRRVPMLIERLGARRLFLVCGRSSFDRCGAADALRGLFQDRQVHRFFDFGSNPRIEDVTRGVQAFRAVQPQAVLAVGGGSALDMAKLVNAMARQDADPLDIVFGRASIRRPGVPLIAVPTTSGSGSEATHFGVVYVNRAKYSVAATSLLPHAAVIDPGLTDSLSPATTAVTGMDAFAQAVESFWSVHSCDESKAYSRRAIALVLRHLLAAVHAPTPDARRGMSKAAYLAGRAINITKTTGPHAMSYPLTSHFGIPHGHAVALTLGRWLLFNSEVGEADVSDPRGALYVRQTVAELVRMMGCGDADECCHRIEALMADIGLETRLSSMGVSSSAAIDVVVPNVNAERLINNPRAQTTSGLRQLVETVC